MRIIVSPTKQMVSGDGCVAPAGAPVYKDKAQQVLSYLQSLSFQEAMKLWGCSQKLAQEAFEVVQDANLENGLTPAVLAYDGIAFKYMAPSVFEQGQFDYLQDHLRILSGMYGVLRPLDGITSYRLEMQAKAAVNGSKNLYDFWGKSLYDQVMDESGVVVNLASKEYSRCIERYLTQDDAMITCVFGQIEHGRVVQKGVYAKMARGDMVRFMAEGSIEDPEEIQSYNRMGYVFDEDRSSQTEYVFIKD